MSDFPDRPSGASMASTGQLLRSGWRRRRSAQELESYLPRAHPRKFLLPAKNAPARSDAPQWRRRNRVPVLAATARECARVCAARLDWSNLPAISDRGHANIRAEFPGACQAVGARLFQRRDKSPRDRWGLFRESDVLA